MYRLRLAVISLGLILLTGLNVFAEPNNNEVGLKRIVVTPVRFTQELQKIPASVSLITRQDIENSNAQTVPAILRMQTGLVIRDYYGNGTKVSADLRGFGETAGSNTLVLVDGRRINEIDLSGVDWTQIPLDRIERIEIVRGANSVLYGDNATGGVINIITKTGKDKPKLEFQTIGGSYDMNKQGFSINGSEDKLSYFLSVSRNSTHGYRKNSEYRATDFSSKLIYSLSDNFSVGLNTGYHDADYGLPGALRESQLMNCSRRDSKNMNDDAGEEDWYILLNTKVNFWENSEAALPVSFRRRNMDTYWGSYGAFNSSNKTSIDTISICPKLTLHADILERSNVTIFGFDFYKVDSKMNDFSATGDQTGDSDVDKKSMGGYLQNELSVFDNLTLNAGYRYEKAKYNFNYTDLNVPKWYTDVNDSSKFNEEVFKTGLAYNYKNNSKLFLNIARSFRLPVTEEFMVYDWLAWPAGRTINKDLLAQKSLNYELGMNHKLNSKLEIDLTVFLMKVDNEIFYNPLTGNNENYDKTQHRGLELSWNWNMLDDLDLFGNYTFTEAIFDEGDFNKNQIPAVPHHKTSLGLNWRITPKWQVNGLLNYVGKRYFISDQSHDYPKMDDFVTLDIKVSYKFTDSKLFAGINNIFDDKYSEYGVIYSERGFYPSPGRNFIAGCSLKF